MIIDIKIPSPGESISEVELTKWLVSNGDFIEKEQEIAEIESEKASLTLFAEDSGKIEIIAKEGSTIPVGDVVGKIDTEQKGNVKTDKNIKDIPTEEALKNKEEIKEDKHVKITPVARNIMEKNNISLAVNSGTDERIDKNKVLSFIQKEYSENSDRWTNKASGNFTKQPMSQLRKKLSERLVTSKNETAMLTTFNEVDMSNIISLKNQYREKFVEKHEVKLGFMSFFTKASALALMKFKNVNSSLDGNEIIFYNYADIGIAVQTEKGLMVPILKNVESMDIPEIEKKIADLAQRARSKKISIEELEGGTFTISNGGVFGSMLSTPIINYPQAAILGMHNIIDRPVAIGGKVEIRPMMYIALSYDHRLIDGKDSVSFLVYLKSLLENPLKILFNGNQPEEFLLKI